MKPKSAAITGTGKKLKLMPASDNSMEGTRVQSKRRLNFNNGLIVEICFHLKSSQKPRENMMTPPKAKALTCKTTSGVKARKTPLTKESAIAKPPKSGIFFVWILRASPSGTSTKKLVFWESRSKKRIAIIPVKKGTKTYMLVFMA